MNEPSFVRLPRPLPWFDKILIAGRQPEHLVLPIAHNDPPGDYEIRVVDLFTDEGPSIRLTVR